MVRLSFLTKRAILTGRQWTPRAGGLHAMSLLVRVSPQVYTYSYQ